MARDRLDRLCAAAGLPFVRLREADVYSVQDVAAAVLPALGRGVSPGRGPAIADREAGAALRDLAEVIGSERRGTAPGTPDLSRRRPDVTAVSPASPAPLTRTEPKVSIHDDIDLGPDLDLAPFAADAVPERDVRRRASI
jgi:hypothetical protein